MSLQDQLNAFKKKIQAQPVLSAPRPVSLPATSANSPSPGSWSDSSGLKKRKRPKSTIVYSTPAETGTGSHLLSNLTYAVEYLKRSDVGRSLEEIVSYLSVQATPSLVELLRRHEKVEYDEATNVYRFRPIHSIRSAYDLLEFFKLHIGRKGLLIKDLKDGWSNAAEEIERLESERQVLLIRSKKEDVPRMVFGNDLEKDILVDEEFRELWHSLTVPPTPDLPRELAKANLKPISVDPLTIRQARPEKKEKMKKTRRGKITNTHLPGILRDYSSGRLA